MQGCVISFNFQDGENILDMCAALGGKTTHILKIKAKVVVVDVNKQRLSYILDNLGSLKLKAEVKQGDAPATHHNGMMVDHCDRILLDVSCLATGVMRRHPNVKWLNSEHEINTLTELQAKILDTT